MLIHVYFISVNNGCMLFITISCLHRSTKLLDLNLIDYDEALYGKVDSFVI